MKGLLALYIVVGTALTGGVAQILHTFVLSPKSLLPFNPVSEEVYWVPAQAQIALERLNAEVQKSVQDLSDVGQVQLRITVLQSKLHEMLDPSDVQKTLETIPDFEARRQVFVAFLAHAKQHAQRGTLADMQALLEEIADFRDATMTMALDARTLEVTARINRDEEVTKNRHLLFGTFLAMWLFMLVIGWLALSRILTKNRQLAAQTEMLEAKKLALDAAVAAEVARNTFLGKVSHEFNSPLQAMLTNIQLLEPRLTDERAQTIIRRLLTSVNQLRVQVSDLLDVAEIKSGKLSLRLARVDVPTLLADIVGVHQIAADSKNLALTVKAEVMPPVYTDGRRIAQIVTNLVTNAIRHTDHGSVSVQAQLKMIRTGQAITLTVADTGTGFAPEIRENLFQPFVQAKRYRGGTGLGLAIVKGLVDQFNGQIKLKSQMGRGSTFTVEIPVSLEGDDTGVEDDLTFTPTPAIAAPVEVAIVNGVDVANARKPTVLIVEDNSDLLDTFSEFLQDSGFDVHAASSFQAGKSMLEARRYFAIVTDMELGDGSGMDIAREARKGLNTSVPIVCCTAYPKLIEGEEAGIFDARLSKPLNPAALLKVLSKMTQGQQTEHID